MADHFGISQALISNAEIYFQSSRRSGRTTSLIDSVQNGDRIVARNSIEAKRLNDLLREAKKGGVVVVIIDPRNPHPLFRRPPSEGRTLFDHTWVEEFYTNSLQDIANTLGAMQRESSGFGEAHRKTQRAAERVIRQRHIGAFAPDLPKHTTKGK